MEMSPTEVHDRVSIAIATMSAAVMQLGQLFAATLVPDQRKQAEAALETASMVPGFLRGLFEVIITCMKLWSLHAEHA